MTPRQSFADLAGQAREVVAALARNGCARMALTSGSLEKIQAWGRVPVAARARPRQAGPERTPSLESVRLELGDCQRCRLAQGRRHIVFGEGAARARLVFVGEGPGGDEDRQGRPFVGAAGQLLTRIIGAMGLDRAEVYICNIIKCRPPSNRNPLPEEIETCLPFLRDQLAAIEPGFICALGSVAARSLLGTDAPISRLRGRFHDMGGISVMPTFHPAFLLRNPERKREVWEDMKQLMGAMGLPVPG